MQDLRRTPVPTGLQLYGIDDSHVQPVDAQWCVGSIRMHGAAIAAFAALRRDACKQGFDLRVVSGFRSFARQLAIWNAKALGEKPVLDAQEHPLLICRLAPRERVFAILRWSALPGASRHHWGTDIDVIDAAAVPSGYRLRLDVAETRAGGPFAALHEWLDERIAAGSAHGFFRPYTGQGCEVAAEPWHLSLADVAVRCQLSFDPQVLSRLHMDAKMELCDEVRDCREEILARYFMVPLCHYPPGSVR